MMYSHKANHLFMIRSYKCPDNDVEQRAQPKLTVPAEGDFPLCFTALDRGSVQ